VKAAEGYQISQKGESSKSSSNDDFTRDNQKMKNLGKQIISHVEQMSTLIRDQYNLMHSLDEDFLRLQEGTEKKKRKSSRTTWMLLCAQLPKSPMWENQPGRSLQDLRYQTQVAIGQSKKTVEELMKQVKNCISPLKDGGGGVIEDWPKIKETIDEIMGCMKSNGETIRSMRSALGMMGQSEINNQVSALNNDAAKLLELAMGDINNLDHLVSEKIFQG
jgi:hypothetical protein